MSIEHIIMRYTNILFTYLLNMSTWTAVWWKLLYRVQTVQCHGDISGVTTAWTGAGISTPLSPEGVSEIDSDQVTLYGGIKEGRSGVKQLAAFLRWLRSSGHLL